MDTRPFGTLGKVSCLTLGGGGIGQVWGPTSRGEAVDDLKLFEEMALKGSGSSDHANLEFNQRLPQDRRLIIR